MPKIVKLCALNSDGIQAFATFLKASRENEIVGGASISVPNNLLNDPAFLERTDFNREVDLDLVFQDRSEFGSYLLAKLETGFLNKNYDVHGVWAWLALAYFPQLRSRRTNRYEHYIPYGWFKNPIDWFPGNHQSLDYRHAVRSSLEVAEYYGEDGRFFVSPKGMGFYGDASEQLLSEQWIKSNKRVRTLLFDFYRDKSGYVKKGALDHKLPRATAKGSRKGYGGIRRLTDDIIPRIKLTHDVEPMPTKDLLKACGPEFEVTRVRALKRRKA